MTAQLDIAGVEEERTVEQRPRPWRGAIAQHHDMEWLAVGVTLVTLVTLLFGMWGSGWNLALPLDDTFIHFQYARQLAAGHPFQFNTGDPASSGDSSFIYPFILAPAFLTGFGGMKAVYYADGLNFVAHLAAVLLLYSLVLRLVGRPAALVAAGFLLLDGSLNWTYLTGMETGVYAGALVLFFWLWVRGVEANHYGWLAAAGVLIALLRPEGHVLASVVCVLTAIWLWRTRGFDWRYGWLMLPVLAGLVPYVVNQVTTGYWQFNTAAAKSPWYVPYSPLHEKLSLTVGTAITAIKDGYFGFDIGRSPFPLLAAPVSVAGAVWALSGRRHRFFHLLLVLTFLLGVGSAFLLPPIHFYRYFQPYDPIFILYFALGLVAVARVATRGVAVWHENGAISRSSKLKAQSSVLVAAVAAAAVLLLPQFVAYIFAEGESTRDIYYQQMAFSEWLKNNTPADAHIGVNDTGAHKYLSDRYIVDLIGLTYNQMRGAYFSGWGTIYDRMMETPEKERPGYILIHPNVFLTGIPESVSQNFLTPLYSITVQNPIITAGPTEVLYKINWEYALLDQKPTYRLHKGEQPLDTLNVGDLEDEQRHTYKMARRQPSISEAKAILTTAGYAKKGFSMSESGRIHSGWEEFSVKSVPGKPLSIVSRTRMDPNASQSVAVWANGKQVGVWIIHNEGGREWQEHEYVIPAQFVTGDRTTIRLDATFDPGGPGFTSYRYWVYGP